MSFANDVREEISRGINDRDRQYACLYGILLYCHTLSDSQIIIQTESPVLAKLLPDLFHIVLHIEVPVESHATAHGINSVFTITDPDQLQRIFSMYHIHPEQREIRLSNIGNNSLSSFVAGIFLCCGSVTDPDKGYHLEFQTPSDLLCSDLQKLLHSIQVYGHKIMRHNIYVLYIKDSEQIEDTLTYMGAQQCTISLMNVKIRKDMRNKANRLRNCDEANINKVVNTAMRQVEEIQYLIDHGEWDKLSPELKEVAQIRLDNPELSMQEIGEMLSPPISRSGVNHRFHKISDQVRELKENGSNA